MGNKKATMRSWQLVFARLPVSCRFAFETNSFNCDKDP